jgi:dTDP-glucose 4,6-dehydratase
VEKRIARVLVTGAGGFIGSHVTERLTATGADVRAFVRYTSSGRAGHLDALDVRNEVDVVLGDLRDEDAVRRAMKGVEIVFHLGALIGIPYSYIHPRETADTNINGTLNVLLAARDEGVERVVHTSSSEVYGTARSVPIDENHPLQGQSPYSATKIGADKLAESFADSFGLAIVTLRPFNTYGPRQSARAVIPTIVTQALTGAEVALGNLSPTRDFTFVTDTVDGFVAAYKADAAVGRVVNLGSGTEISIADLVAVIGSVIGKEISVTPDPNRVRPGASEVERLLSDNTLARELLGWSPRMSLPEGLARTVEWISENLADFRVGTYEV